MLILTLKHDSDPVKNHRVIIGGDNNDDNKDTGTRIAVIGHRDAGKGVKEGVRVLIEEPQGSREQVLPLREEVSIGQASVKYLGRIGGDYKLAFEAPKEVAINRETIFHRKAREQSENATGRYR